MKVDIGNESKKEKYPYIGEHDSLDIIVLFTSKDSGICLYTTEEDSEVGEYNTEWNEEFFTKYEKTIRISND